MHSYILCNHESLTNCLNLFDNGEDTIDCLNNIIYSIVGNKQDFIEHLSDVYNLLSDSDIYLMEFLSDDNNPSCLYKSQLIDYYTITSDACGLAICPQWYTLLAEKLFTYKTKWDKETGVKWLTSGESSNGTIRFTKSSLRYACFSNFYRCDVMYDGMLYLSSEAAWQAQKTLDMEIRKSFTFMSPAVSKKAGRSVLLRPDWERAKTLLMLKVLLTKFSQNPDLAEVLLNTGNAYIIEDTTSWHDNIWGHCTCSRCVNKVHENRLGKLLVLTRKALRGENIF